MHQLEGDVTLGIVLLGLIAVAVLALLAVTFVSSLGLEVDQKQVKKSLIVIGLLLCVRGFFSSWVHLVLGIAFIALSHPKLNLPGFARRLDKSLDQSDNPARYVP